VKPHQLVIEAFGPFVETTTIDFDALGEEGLFLIHGSTGAGKTFLLDALCFALYGEVSGERSVKGLRSQQAPPAAVPRVELVFSCAGERWRLERSPAWSAPKTRGQGFTEKAPQAVLWRLRDGGAEPVVSRLMEVAREVERLVGLNAAQFRQVILLPQGRFAEVLRSGAEEREALLKTLFHTLPYERAAAWLEDQARAARLDLAERQRLLEGLRARAAQVAGAFAPMPEPPADQADLEALQQRIAAVAAAAADELERSTAALQAAQAAQAQAERLADRWDRRQAAAERLADLEGKGQAVEEHRRKLARAERAEALRASLVAEAVARQGLERLGQRIAEQLAAAAAARRRVAALPELVRRLDLAALPGLEALAEARAALAAWRSQLGALASRADEATAAAAAADEAGRLAVAAGERLVRDGAAQVACQGRLEAARLALQVASTARDQLDGLQRAAEEASGRAQAAAGLAAAEAVHQGAVAARHAADAERNRCQAAVLELRRRQLAGMAARLAGELVEGEACPVCGSDHHPAPARPAADAVNDDRIAAADQAEAAAGEQARGAAAALATAEAELRALREKAGPLEPAAAALAARRAGEALEAARAAAADLDSRSRAISALEHELQALQGALQAAAGEQARCSQTAAEAAGRAAAWRAEIAAVLGVAGEPRQLLAALPPLEAALRDLAGGAEAVAGATAQLEQAAARLAAELAGSGFTDGEAVRAALEDESWRRRVAERIEAYGRDLIAVRGLLASPELAALPEQRPDTAAAQAASAAADGARTAAVERHSEARVASVELDRQVAEHRRLQEALAAARQQAQRLVALAERCGGKVAPFISLQRWVLSAHLAEICRYANQRLELMTSGRYQLRLSDGGGRGGRQAGLGLRVLDAYTGEEREVSSLSGGETFQASLALALGVADTVQAHAGGVRLEALFIDEGFGSLDPDNLQLALDELDRLREGGRMIGVISHVAALRERIRAGIQVSGGERGSTARLCRSTIP
jgi:exonuclease SbcC